MILGGVWFGKQHPVFNTVMKPIREELLELEEFGMCTVTWYECCYTIL